MAKISIMFDITFQRGAQILQHEVQVIRNVTEGLILVLEFLIPWGVIMDMEEDFVIWVMMFYRY